MPGLSGHAAHGLATESWFHHSSACNLVKPLESKLAAIKLQAAHDLLSSACSPSDYHQSSSQTQTPSPEQSGLQWRRLPLFAGQPVNMPRQVCHLSRQCVVSTPAGKYELHIREARPAGFASHAAGHESPAAKDSPTTGHAPSKPQQQNLGHNQKITERPVCIFLHGFLGDGGDWTLIMTSLALTHRCVALDLPGHGKSRVHPSGNTPQHQHMHLRCTPVVINSWPHAYAMSFTCAPLSRVCGKSHVS